MKCYSWLYKQATSRSNRRNVGLLSLAPVSQAITLTDHCRYSSRIDVFNADQIWSRLIELKYYISLDKQSSNDNNTSKPPHAFIAMIQQSQRPLAIVKRISVLLRGATRWILEYLKDQTFKQNMICDKISSSNNHVFKLLQTPRTTIQYFYRAFPSIKGVGQLSESGT